MARSRKAIQTPPDDPLPGQGMNTGKLKLATTVLVFCVAALLALGMVMLYSSSSVMPLKGDPNAQMGAVYLIKQLTWCALGLMAGGMAACLDYRVLKKAAWPLLAFAVLLLVLVLVPHIGRKINGARRWFSFGGVSFQPSEFAKLALIIALAWYGERFQRQMPSFKRGILVPGLLIGSVVGLIFVEVDVGNGLLLATVSGILLLIAGIRLKHFLPPVVIMAVAVSVFIYNDPTRSERIHSWLHVEETKHTTGMQAYQAMLALGSGGLTGRGLGEGRQKLGFIPFSSTDFIFAIIGEELGLVATLLVIQAFVALVISGIYIAWNSRDLFGLLLGSGITFLIGLQAFINIGVVTSALPNKGLLLPFISYGGSNLLMMLIGVGLLISIARKGYAVRRVAPESTEPIFAPVLSHS